MRIVIFSFLLINFRLFAAVTEWVDFELVRGHIQIPILVKGIPTKAILDSGAQVNAISQSFINRHELSFLQGRNFLIKGANGTEKKKLYNTIPANLFGVDVEFNTVVPFDLQSFNGAMIIGANFFDKFIVQLDYPNQKMRLFTRDAIDLKKSRNIKMKPHHISGMPIVKVNLNNERETWLVLDTGYNGGLLLKRSIARETGWLNKYQVNGITAQGINQTKEHERFQLPEMTFGPFKVENILAVVPIDGQKMEILSERANYMSRIKGTKVDGLIGFDVFRHFLLTLDYKKGMMHVGLPE